MLTPGLHHAKIWILVAIVFIMFTAATNKVAVDSITAISSSSRSADPDMLGPPASTCTSATAPNCSGADEIHFDDETMTIVATNTIISSVPRALPQPFHQDGDGLVTDDLKTTTSHEGCSRDEITDVGGENIMLDVDAMTDTQRSQPLWLPMHRLPLRQWARPYFQKDPASPFGLTRPVPEWLICPSLLERRESSAPTR